MGHSEDDTVHKKKKKRIGRISVSVWFKILYRIRLQKIDVILIKCPFKQCFDIMGQQGQVIWHRVRQWPPWSWWNLSPDKKWPLVFFLVYFNPSIIQKKKKKKKKHFCLILKFSLELLSLVWDMLLKSHCLGPVVYLIKTLYDIL